MIVCSEEGSLHGVDVRTGIDELVDILLSLETLLHKVEGTP